MTLEAPREAERKCPEHNFINNSSSPIYHTRRGPVVSNQMNSHDKPFGAQRDYLNETELKMNIN